VHGARVPPSPRRLKAQGFGVISLAQFSMAHARSAIEQALELSVVTTPDSAMCLLRQRLGG